MTGKAEKEDEEWMARNASFLKEIDQNAMTEKNQLLTSLLIGMA